MDYTIEGIDPGRFAPLFSASSEELSRLNARIMFADNDSYPCRVSLTEATRGDTLLLVNYQHQPAASPYRSAHAIFVARGSQIRGTFRNEIPPIIRARTLSIRAFDTNHLIVAADIVEGSQCESLIRQLLDRSDTAYLHVHFAKRGCFAATARRI
jgi:hypothetical protein